VELFTNEHARHAIKVAERFGKRPGHRESLNFGDVCADALAAAFGDSLLFKGEDFVGTDIASALAGW
jgi:ribonuclease VapC